MSTGRLVVRDDAEVPSAAIAEYEATRRDLVRGGLLSGLACVGASAVPLLLGVRNAFAQVSGDAPAIAAAVDLEQRMVFAYGAALGAAGLDRATRSLLTLLLGHERQHAGEMLVDLQQISGTPPASPQRANDLRGAALGLAGASSRHEVLTFAAELEAMAIASYRDAMAHLSDARTIQSAATVMAAEGQHLVLLRTALAREPIPTGLEVGRV
jgi:rubrerythrin